jgi:hypothetical protein
MWLLYGYSYKFVLETANSVLVNTYDNIAGLLTTIPSTTPSVPSGCILIWSGSVGSIPSGFVLCDGNNGTPDLRNSFILGAGNTYTVGQTGGSTDAIVVSHTHSASSSSSSSVSDPSHSHGLAQSGTSGPGGYYGAASNQAYNMVIGTNDAYTGISVSTSTSTSINATGTSGANANMPPYYALAYIQKT